MSKQRIRMISTPRVYIKREAIDICLERSDIAVTSYRRLKAQQENVEDFGIVVKSDYAPYKRLTPMYMIDFPALPPNDPNTTLSAVTVDNCIGETVIEQKPLPFICPVCDMSFHFKSRLRTHVSTRHLNLKNFACNVCNRRFKLKHHLKYHAKTHDKKRKWQRQKALHVIKGEKSVDELIDYNMRAFKSESEDVVSINDDECYDYEFLQENDVKIDIDIERYNPGTFVTINTLEL